MLINPVTGQTRLLEFGIASRLPRERQAPQPPETIAGTPAYMAPEQTGRMNRSIDARSDLYALVDVRKPPMIPSRIVPLISDTESKPTAPIREAILRRSRR